MTLLRIVSFPLLLYSFYLLGLPLEIIALLAVLFALILLLRGRMWKAAENLIEKYFPVTKKWPEWAHKAVVIIAFATIYLILKQAIYILLGFAGIDLEEIIAKSIQGKIAQ